ncbi:oxidoreductase, short-chain dehydrogenase/reductase family protein [Oceanicaulis sp. HTCC2633]|uniref:SDR family oxidoreductase n=1 Tax=Oceanicaulis sp. HTCC2633 TaxID=314254 RepID=UPI0000669851|nr:SDR family oxidoreductase [Oceanicaulis sp. HTCC2633]EAP89441.1 oxidoreductase, short-chain dehydrogenase/reductase family protein [Oceanicaulis sp. HTCC2633]
MSEMKRVMITGASTGIGYASAKYLADKGWRVYAGVRKPEDAERLSAELGASVYPVLCDVTDAGIIKSAAEQVQNDLQGQTLDGLVNNAGIAVAGPLLHLPPEEMTRQLDVNVTGQLRVTQAFAPLMGARADFDGQPGRIVNISSVAGFQATPMLTPYACSKFALEAFTEGLRRELMLYGIDVVAINPGPIQTPIWDKAETMDIEPYAHTDYARPIQKILKAVRAEADKALPAVRVAEAIHTALTDKRPKLNTIVIRNRFEMALMKVLPRRSLDRLIAKALGLSLSKR